MARVILVAADSGFLARWQVRSMTTNDTGFAKDLLIAAAFAALDWDDACIAVEQACGAVTWAGAVVADGAAKTVTTYIKYLQTGEDKPLWMVNAGL